MSRHYEKRELLELERNRRISEALKGSMKPPDEAIIQKLKNKKHGKTDAGMRIPQDEDGTWRRKSRGRRCP